MKWRQTWEMLIDIFSCVHVQELSHRSPKLWVCQNLSLTLAAIPPSPHVHSPSVHGLPVLAC